MWTVGREGQDGKGPYQSPDGSARAELAEVPAAAEANEVGAIVEVGGGGGSRAGAMVEAGRFGGWSVEARRGCRSDGEGVKLAAESRRMRESEGSGRSGGEGGWWKSAVEVAATKEELPTAKEHLRLAFHSRAGSRAPSFL